MTSSYEDRGRICFTGFDNKQKCLLEVMAESIGFKVITDVTGKVALLVTGGNAGQKKIEKAQKFGANVVDEDGFLQIASVAGVTIEQAQEKINALIAGDIQSGDTKETQNVGICPYCNDVVIPMPKNIRKCPSCSKPVVPIGGRLISIRDILQQLASHKEDLVLLMSESMRRVVLAALPSELDLIKEMLLQSLAEIDRRKNA